MSSEPAASPTADDLPGREVLREAASSVLKDEGEGSARVLRVDLPSGPVVLKEWAPRSRLLGLWARFNMRREIRHYRLLDGVPGIPRLLASWGDEAFLLEFVEGRPLKRDLGPVRAAAAVDNLERTLAAVHGRRFVHLDLHQKLNTLVGPDDRIWLVDLGQGLDCSRGWLRRLLFPLLARVDRRALVKFRARYAPQSLPEADRARLERRHAHRESGAFKQFHRGVRRRLGRRGDGDEG